MMRPTIRHLATDGDTFGFPAGAHLYAVVVGTAATSAVVTLYDGTDTNGTVLGLINAATAQSGDYHGARFPRGLLVALTGGDAKVSVIAG